METNGAVAAAILLLLQLSTCCRGANQSQSVSNQLTHRYIYPDNFQQLQQIIRSDMLVILKGKIFNVNERTSLIVIENVSNFIISGGESGSLIYCSPKSTFGFHLKNATNVTLRGLIIRNCDSAVPSHLLQNLQKLPYHDMAPLPPATSVLVEASTNVFFTRVHIEHSLVQALTIIGSPIDAKYVEPFFSLDKENPHLTLTDCKISHSSKGSMVIYGPTSVLIERTVIANSGTCIVSFSADIMLRNFHGINCTSHLEGGHVTVREKLTMNQSSLAVQDLHLHINGSKVLFYGDNSQRGLTAYRAQLFISENSAVVFTRFNLTDIDSSALHSMDSTLQVNNSTLTFTDNNVSGRGHNIIIISHYNKMKAESSIVIINNSVTNATGLLFFINSTIVLSAGRLLFEKNDCKNSSYLMMNTNTNTKLEKRSFVSFEHNKIYKESFMFYSESALLEVSESSLVITNNSVAKESKGLVYINSSINLRASRFLFEENECKYSSSLMEFLATCTKVEMGSLVNFTQNQIHRHSYMLLSHQEGKLEITESSLVVTNNSVTSKSYVFHCNYSTTVINSGVLLFKENVCQRATIMDFFDAKMKLEKQSVVNFTHNNVSRESWILRNRGVNLSIHESSMVFTNNTVTDESIVYFCRNSTAVIDAGVFLFKENECNNGALMVNFNASIKFEKRSLVSLTHNKMYNGSETFENDRVILNMEESSLVITSNSMSGSDGCFFRGTYTTMEKKSVFNFSNNHIHSSNAFDYRVGSWTMSSDSKLEVVDNKSNELLIFDSTKVNFSGTVRVANNNNSFFGAQSFISSKVWFGGSLEVVGNIGGGIYSLNSDIFITDRAIFSDNYASNGGALTLISSVVHISPNATVDLTRNHATFLGGAIFISEPRTTLVSHNDSYRMDLVPICSIQIIPVNSSESCQFFSLTFNQNRAGTAGNAIYGGHTSACLPCGATSKHLCYNCPVPDVSDLYRYNGVNDSSDLSSFTSDPTRVCFCENGIPDCYKVTNTVTVHPGEQFILSLAIVGYGLGTVPGSVIARGSNDRGSVSEQNLFGSEFDQAQEIREAVCGDVGYSIVSEKDREQISLTVETESFVKSEEEAQSVVDFELKRKTEPSDSHFYNTVYENFFYIPVFVEVGLLPCPVGFQLMKGRCVCHQILLENNIDTCSFYNGTALILRPAPFWVGLPNETNSSILVNPHCPFDYCKLEDINITAESPNTQCQYQRSGILCGSCREGLSVILGSSECKTCSNIYLVSIGIFILMGVSLVIMVTLLNMTVSVGTLNGLVFFANILQANRTTFLPPTTSHTSPLIAFLSAFIAWVNLDLGIPMCFFDGLTTYAKTWLQFVFPLYILALVGVIIIASNYSTRVTRLLGTNTVSVLATLVLLSYTKILRILITAFSFTTLTGSQGYHSVVWLADGNLKYFEPKHAILFLVALVVLLLLGVPYTVTLTAAPWIQRSSCKWVSSAYNRFKPLFDAYMGPYKDQCRYWTGMLLLARVVLIVLFSSISNTVDGPQLNLLLLSLSSSTLIGLAAYLKPYKCRLLNGLEIFHLSILFIFSSCNLYVTHTGTGIGPRAYIYIVLVGICFLVFLGICVGRVWYRVRKAQTGRRPEPPQREEDDYRPLFWKSARVRAEDEERKDITISTAGATNTISHGGRRDSLVELIVDGDPPQ